MSQSVDHTHPFAVALTGALSARNQCAADRVLASKGLQTTRPVPRSGCWCGMHEEEEKS